MRSHFTKPYGRFILPRHEHAQPAAVKKTAVGALVTAEIVSVLGTRMTYLALPWFVLVTTGSPGKMTLVLAAEIAPMAVLGIPSGMLVQRLGSRNTMLVADFARAPILASIPLLHAAGHAELPAAARARRAARLLHAAVLRVAADDPPRARRRGRAPDVAGEQPDRGRRRVRRPDRARARGALIPFIGAPNVLYVDAATYLVAFLLVLAFVPRRKPVVAPPAKALAGVRFLLGDRLLGPIAAWSSPSGSSARACPPGSRSTPTTSSTGAPASPGCSTPRSARARSSGSLVAVLAVRKVAPLRLSGFAILAFAVPLWVLPFLPPWPVVFLALFAAMLFTPLINGPLIAVLTARTPEAAGDGHHRGHLVNTLAAPLGFLVAGQVLEHWGVVPLFTAVVAG